MNSSMTSFIALFFIFSFFHHLPCTVSKQGLGWCETLFQCGNITAGYPFWGRNRREPCGHPLLELHCNINITSLIISNQEFHVLHINQTSNTLRLARADLQGPFCSAQFITTAFLPEVFHLPHTSTSLTVYYFCDPRLHYLSSFTCPDKGLVSLSQNPEYSCENSFTVNVPTSFVPKENNLNLTQLEIGLRNGFELGVEIYQTLCKTCSSSGGICSFNSTNQVCCYVTLESGVKCSPLVPNIVDGDDLYRRCNEPFRCGSRDYLSYPFWIPGREECGHPDYKVNCSSGFPELTVGSMNLRINVISYSRTRLSRPHYISNICTPDLLNVPINSNILPFSHDTELLTLYYDCLDLSSDVTYFGYVGELGCVNHDKSYYVTKNISSPYLDRYRGILNKLERFCRRNVSIPASGPALIALQTTPTPDNLRNAIEQGFEVGPDQNCSACMESFGACGYSHISNGFICHCTNGSQGYTCNDYRVTSHGLFSGAEIGSIVGVILLAFLVLLVPFLVALVKVKISENMRQKELMSHIQLKRYSFAQAKRITNSFAEVIGKGGFGTVYKGTLSDGRMVAVKVLKETKGDGEDFINEVASMSKTSHVNIVSLVGFCLEGFKRAVIYEFVGNGSLDRFISGKTPMNMDWKTLYGIALGVSRGLEYLHHGCKTRIVHFDIKPHNILLDDNLCPKVSDFGLARVCEKKESTLLLLDTRGTVGYIAPEMISRVYGSVSHKSDVYSYGMLVLEMIGARNKKRADQSSASNTSSMYFPDWVYKDLERGSYGRPIENGLSSEEEEIARKMTLVGLWCIQSSPSDRPPMNKVVEMMEGSVDVLEVPPRPVLQQIPAAPLPESSSWISEENSRTSEVLVCSTSTN